MLTYILGAGASYQSIPIVNTFPKRFQQFIKDLNGFSTFSGDKGVSNKKFENARDIGRTLGTSFESHQSFDTYFKKLFHTNEIALIKKYKKLLNLYFIWEHLQDNGVFESIDGNAEGVFYKESKVDKRYDALIAGLLQPIAGGNKMFCKTNFITWNYDLNLISSIKNYFSPEATFKEFLEEIGYKNSVWNIKDQIYIVNMNGFFYSEVFDESKDIYHLYSFDSLNKRMEDNYFDDDYIAEDAELIKFAWETDNTDDKIEAAKIIIKKSKNIVVVGYTFPMYNRLVDSAFLTYGFNGKDLTIQDPNAENIIRDFIFYFDASSNSNYMKTIINCSQFFVPNNIVK